MSYISGHIFGEKLIGTSGDDTIDGKGGSLYDIIDGGEGNDTALIFDNIKNYSVLTLSGITHVVPLPSASSDYRYGDTILTHVEYLQFSDAKLSLETTSVSTVFGGHTYFPSMKIVGTANDDIFDFLGNDYPIDGGAGNDTVLLFDKQSNYEIITLGGITRIISSYESYSWYKYHNYTLTNVEYIQFSDGVVALPGAPKIITGGIGNDTLSGSADNDKFDGGPGIDTVIYSGIRSAFQVAKTSTGYTVGGGSEGTDALINIERLQFTDKTIAFDLDGNAGQVYRLYQAAFDRVPDQGGLGYWINEIDRGTGLSQAATGFINSAEFKALYGNNPSNSEFVTLIYDNVLHRTPDAGGYSYWMEQLSSGMTRENVLIGFSESTENKVALMAFSMDGNMGKDYRLYQAAFDRKPDVSGLDYWYHQMNSGVTLQQVASGFINSAEFKALYGNNSSNAELVTLLYDNVLHRAPDTGGFNFWMNELDQGTSREQVLIGFSESLENQLSLVGIVQTGIEFV